MTANDLRLAVLFSSLSLCLAACSHGQGLAESAEGFATDYMVDLAFAPDQLPSEYAVVARSESLIIRPSGDVQTTDTIYAFAQRRIDNQETQTLSALGYKNFYEDRPRHRFWDRYLVTPSDRFRRSGSRNSQSARRFSESQDTPDEEAKLKLRPHAHPMFLPVALRYKSLQGHVGLNFGSQMLERFELDSAEYTEDRKLKSVWSYEQRKVDVYFDRTQGNRPTRIIYRGAMNEHRPKEWGEKIEAVHDIKWQRKRWRDSSFCWVPVEYRQMVIDRINHKEHETTGYMRWVEGEHLVPDPPNLDWLSNIERLTEENWTLDFPEWLRLQER